PSPRTPPRLPAVHGRPKALAATAPPTSASLPPMKLRALVLLAVLHLLAAAFFLHACGWGFPLDDAWGHLVYGRALATWQGLAYNPGQPEAGVTSRLWTYLCARPAGLVEWHVLARPDRAVRALGLLFGLAGTVVGARLAA